ncbi:hypothetical protein GCM10009804_41820 [Kribbella hippodromi]|uniref:Uncharacterized protein n=1 Tax=Kribbella hippodromi TaxID=434347 RepID=A0ABP4PKK9_9ACTN
MFVDELNCRAPAGGEAKEIHLAKVESFDQAVGVAYDELRLQLVVGQTARTPAAAAEVEQDNVMITRQRFETGKQIGVTDVGTAVNHHERRAIAALPELPDEQRHVPDIHQ